MLRRILITIVTVAAATTMALPASNAGPGTAQAPASGPAATAKKPPPPPPAPALSVRSFQTYRPDSTGGYAAEENGMTSIWWQFTTLQTGKGTFTFTFPAAPAGTKGFVPLQTTDIAQPGGVSVAAQASDCRPVITAIVSAEGFAEQSVRAKYDCPTGRKFILMWRGPLWWNGFADINGPELQPNPNDQWSFPVTVRFAKQITYPTPPVIEVFHFPALPVGLEPVIFLDNVNLRTDYSQPLLLTDLATNNYTLTSVTTASRDTGDAPIQTEYAIIGTQGIGVTGEVFDDTLRVTDPQQPLARQVVTELVFTTGCQTDTTTYQCPDGTTGAIELSPFGFTDESGDSLPDGARVILYYGGAVDYLAAQAGAATLCRAYGGTYNVTLLNGQGLPIQYTCNLASVEKMDQFKADILTFRPAMGAWYCPSRQVTTSYLSYPTSTAAMPYEATCRYGPL